MSDQPQPEADLPLLRPALHSAWPVIIVGSLAWSIAAVAAFLVPDLADWRPVTLAGLGVGLMGTGIFLWQRDAARRGARGAQTGLDPTGDRGPDPHPEEDR